MSFATILKLFITLMIIQSLLLVEPSPSSATDISWNSDILISDNTTYMGDTITLIGNLTITGDLTLVGTELQLDCSACGTYAINVETGGIFNILAGSKIHSTNHDAHFLFRAWSNSTLMMNDSELHDCGWDNLSSNTPNPNTDRGLYIDSNAVSITNSTLTGNNVGIIVDNLTSPYISSNNISWNDASGIEVYNGATPLIDHNLLCHNLLNIALLASGGAIYSYYASPTITNNMISDNIAFNWTPESDGIHAEGGELTIMYNNISGHCYFGCCASGINLYLADAYIYKNIIFENNIGIILLKCDCMVRDNILNQNVGDSSMIGVGYGVYDGSSSVFSNNTYSGNQGGIALSDGSTSIFENETISSNTRGGIEEYEYRGMQPFQNIMTNCTFTGNTMDVLLQDIFGNGAGGTLEMINPSYRPAYVSVSDPNVIFKVEWYLGMQVLFENGSIPVNGALVNITNSKGITVTSLSTRFDGRTDTLTLEEYTKSGGNTNNKLPYNISVKKDWRTNFTAGLNITSSQNLTLFIDNIPPFLEITSPLNNSLTNQTEITMTGRTERDAFVFINDTEAIVKPDGSWSALISLDNEGENEFIVKAQDKTLNEARIILVVFRDTTTPILKLTSPKDGFLTNQTSIPFTGSTSDISANTSINGEQIVVAQDGTFRTYYNLTEGINTIIVESCDAAGNSATIIISGTRDTIAPELTIFQPTNGFATTLDTITIQGQTEPGCILTMNGQILSTNQGEFTIEVTLDEGTNDFTFIARDKAGNTNITVLTIIKDTTPPALDIIYPYDGQLLNQSFVEVRGTTDPGSVVRVDGYLVTLNGTAFCTTIVLSEGSNTITVESMDALQNAVQKSIMIMVDTIPPALNIKSPINRTLTNQTYILVKGTTEPGTVVMINGLDVQMEYDGSFASTINLTVEGVNILSVTARDAAWNMVERNLTIYRDTILYYNITSPQNNITVKTSNINVSGNAELGATVLIDNMTPQLDANGYFAQNLLLNYGLNQITINIKDKAGNSAFEIRNITRAKPPSRPAKGFIPGFDAELLLLALSFSLIFLVGHRRGGNIRLHMRPGQ